MPSLTLVNPRGTTQTVTELGAFEHYLRRGYNPQTGTVAAARTLFTGQSDTPPPLETTAGAITVIHGANATTPRPATALPVIWYGSVNPANADNTLDVWIPVA